MRLRSKREERESLQLYIIDQLSGQAAKTLLTRLNTTSNKVHDNAREMRTQDSENRGWRQGVPMTMAGPAPSSKEL